MIKFYRGAKDSYNSDDYGKGIYFTTDTNEILTGTSSYGKNADTSLTSKEIIIKGGPFANTMKGAFSSGKIPKGTSLEEIIEKLVFEKKDGSVYVGSLNWSPNVGNPTITASHSTAVEVGTKIYFKVTDGTVTGEDATIQCYGTYGYAIGDTKYPEYISSNKKTYTIEGSYTDPSTTITVGSTGYTSGSDIVTDRETTYTCSAMTYSTVSHGALAEVTINPLNNMGEIDTNPKNAKSFRVDANSSEKNSQPITSSITSYYKWCYSFESGNVVNDSSKYPTSASSGSSRFTNQKTISSLTIPAKHTMIVALPPGYKLSEVYSFGSKVDLEATFTKIDKPQSVTIGGNKSEDYTIYAYYNLSSSEMPLTDFKIALL